MLAYHRIKKLFELKKTQHSILVKGWVTEYHPTKHIILHDGSYPEDLHCILPKETSILKNELNEIQKGSSIILSGILEEIDSDKIQLHIEKILQIDLPFESLDAKNTTKSNGSKFKIDKIQKEQTAIIRIYSNLQFSIQKYLHKHEYYQVNPILYKPLGIYAMQLKNAYWIDLFEKTVQSAMGFCDISQCMDRVEQLLKYIVNHTIKHCHVDLEILRKQHSDEKLYKDLSNEKIPQLLNNNFTRLSYTEAIEILNTSKNAKSKRLQDPIPWGEMLTEKQERFLCEKHFKNAIILFDLPYDEHKVENLLIKYNPTTQTARNFHIILPKIGKVIKGFQYEENPGIILENRDVLAKSKKIPSEINDYITQHPNYNCSSSGYQVDLKSVLSFIGYRIKN